MKALLYLPNWLVVNSDIDRLHLHIFARIEAPGGMFRGGRRDGEHYASETRKRAKRGKRKTERDERGSPGRIFYSWNIF